MNSNIRAIKVALTVLPITLSCSNSRNDREAYQADLPNIVLMMGDAHGWDKVGYNGHPFVKTPVLDEMAAVGVRFDRFYSAHPSCSPTQGHVKLKINLFLY